MNTPISAHNYILLGMRMWAVTRTEGANVDTYVQEVNGLFSDLDSCEFAHTRAVASALEQMPIPPVPGTRIINGIAAGQIAMLVKGIRKSIDRESTLRQTIELDVAGVSARLRGLTALSLTDVQKTLLEETIRCVECGAYRAAIVMGWNLAYDYIRQWIATNHATAFSAQLTSRLDKKSKPIFEPITTYEDFFQKRAPSERTVLDIANEVNLIGGEVYDHLCQYLRYRNNYAHPNFKTISRDQANAFIDHLITIIEEPPFK